MRTEVTLQGLQAALSPIRLARKSIGFVPTMGNLHQGHIALVKEAKKYCDVVVVSIFVNPSQFGAGEDFEKYPRTLEADSQLLADAGCDMIFAPSVQQMYGNKPQLTTVQVNDIANDLCGKSRPDHFTGVATVVTKLFNMVQPNAAFFGEKDWQQLAVIRHLTTDLCFSIDIIGVPIVRDEQGLALSSRNGYLSPEEKQTAIQIYKTLKMVEQEVKSGQATDLDAILQRGRDYLTQQGFVVDYLEARTPDLKMVTDLGQDMVVLAAAKLGSTRLIDNLQIKCSH
ncbi:pantoate--beta-alanine ligase [Alkanindiges hydrocarboniclasticus]|jgi:pantoate--beta-alanine ligase|uniref:Pantothenate synthetase n=1 Tax=Alkanindiges hydrocarboniclasticus TaxID=1907941 RepID=A0A1S8CSP1_9GAMM|nr:pantoate--beta-alanine ligase [Alkanindiges hydrocarboniclasticus]ONG38389.1 pantoate--beta-alanine ligase [Alkanindiges hydrocarboniclasticus]